MRTSKLAVVVFGSMLGATATCALAAGQAPGILQATLAEAGAATAEVSTDQVRAIMREKSALLLDTRGAAEFDAGHIPGAVNVPGPDAVAAITRLVDGDKARALVLYCNGPFCQASRRVADQLVKAGFSNVRRYQLGMPVWRALGGPVAVEASGVVRMVKADRSAVLIDARPAAEFAQGTLPGAGSAPVEDILSGKLKKVELPEDDFNRRVILFGRDAAQARALAEHMSKRPWHNVMYANGTFGELAGLIGEQKPGPAVRTTKN